VSQNLSECMARLVMITSSSHWHWHGSVRVTVTDSPAVIVAVRVTNLWPRRQWRPRAPVTAGHGDSRVTAAAAAAAPGRVGQSRGHTVAGTSSESCPESRCQSDQTIVMIMIPSHAVTVVTIRVLVMITGMPSLIIFPGIA
jgi:hypothetical protein